MSAPGFQTFYIDDSLLVLNKPAGLLSVPGRGDDKQDCLSSRVQAAYPDALVVHRLDMATSGLMLMARGAAAQRALSLAFAERRISKRYEAVVQGCLQTPHDAVGGWSTIDLPIAADWPRRPLRVIDTMHGKPSVTRWQLKGFDAAAGTSRLLLEPLTGRSHQLRVHLQALGHPIAGDTLYGNTALPGDAGRLLLHACWLGFVHPSSGKAMDFASKPCF
jgi:tRNA pseudouridine32 synthase/23S rRNA pseudouridine746 synthase